MAERDAAAPRLNGMRTRTLAAAGAVLCMLVAACGSVRAPAVGPVSPTDRHSGPTAAGNKKLAEAEGRRLLLLAPVPAHAVPLRSAPPSLSGPAGGTPGVASLVDKSRSWRLAMPFTAAAAWLAAHSPPGLLRSGSSQGGYYGVPDLVGYSFAGPGNSAWDSADLEVEVAPAGPHASVLRADGVVVWLDPVPFRDIAAGKRLRVLAADGCPRTDSGIVGVTNPGAGLEYALLPAGRPRSGLKCGYYGGNGHPFQLRSEQRLTAAQAQQLAAVVARTRLSHVIGGVFSCPAGDASAELVVFSYRGQPDVDLWIWLNGCGGISNGYIKAGRP
jgi:hypothetical protein